MSIRFSIKLFEKNKKESEFQGYIPGENHKFLPLATKIIPPLAEVRSKSTVDNYYTALRSFARYAGTGVTVGSIDSHLIEGWQQWLIEHHVTQNTVSCYMRSLRSVLYHLSPETKRQSVFDAVFTGKMPTDKRSIPLNDIAKLRRLRLQPGTSLKFSLDIFLFSFYSLGMPFVDIAFLQKRQMANGYIIYHRHKTGQRIRVKIEPPMQQIIDRYTQADEPFVFPILRAASRQVMMREYENARTRYNRHLKKIGVLAGIDQPLTSYVARHSWASMAFHANVDLPIISKALGHTSPNTTLTYLREIDDHRIDVANQRLLQKVSSASPDMDAEME